MGNTFQEAFVEAVETVIATEYDDETGVWFSHWVGDAESRGDAISGDSAAEAIKTFLFYQQARIEDLSRMLRDAYRAHDELSEALAPLMKELGRMNLLRSLIGREAFEEYLKLEAMTDEMDRTEADGGPGSDRTAGDDPA